MYRGNDFWFNNWGLQPVAIHGKPTIIYVLLLLHEILKFLIFPSVYVTDIMFQLKMLVQGRTLDQRIGVLHEVRKWLKCWCRDLH